MKPKSLKTVNADITKLMADVANKLPRSKAALKKAIAAKTKIIKDNAALACTRKCKLPKSKKAASGRKPAGAASGRRKPAGAASGRKPKRQGSNKYY